MLLHALELNKVILIPNGGKGLEMGVNKQDVSTLNVDQCGRGVREALLGTHAHNVLNALVQKFGGHDHTILYYQKSKEADFTSKFGALQVALILENPFG